MTTEPKPLVAGDLVRKRKPMVVTTVGDGLVWTEGGSVWQPSELDVIDPIDPRADLLALASELERLAAQSLELANEAARMHFSSYSAHSARADAYGYSARMLRSTLGGQP